MIKSQDDLNTCNEGKRKSDVLIATIEKCEKLEEKLKIAKEALKQYADKGNWQDCLDWNGYMEDSFVVEKGQFGENGYTVAEDALEKIKE